MGETHSGGRTACGTWPGTCRATAGTRPVPRRRPPTPARSSPCRSGTSAWSSRRKVWSCETRMRAQRSRETWVGEVLEPVEAELVVYIGVGVVVVVAGRLVLSVLQGLDAAAAAPPRAGSAGAASVWAQSRAACPRRV